MAIDPSRPTVRAPTAGGRHQAALVLGAAILLLLVVYVAVRVTGGAPNPLVHFAYIAIALAALSAGWRGGLAAGLAAGLLLGPLMPDSTADSLTVLGRWGWAIRLAAYLGAGVLIGWFWERSRRLAAVIARRAGDERAQELLRASEARLRATVEGTVDGIIVLDGGGSLVLANAAAERIVGVGRGELLGVSYRELAARLGLDQPELLRGRPEAGAALATGSAVPIELALERADRTQRHVRLSVGPLDPGAPADGQVVTLRDVTAERAVARERAAHLAELRAVAEVALGAPTAGAAGEALLGQFARAWPVAAAAIYLFDAGRTERLAVWSPAEAGPPMPRLVPSSRIEELRALTASGPTRTELGRLPGVAEGPALLAERGARSLLVLPLVEGDTLVGALLAGDRQPPEPLGPDEEEYLRAIGRLAAGIVRRAVGDEEASRLHLRDQVAGILAEPALLTPHYQPILSISGARVVGYEALARFRLEPVQPPDAWFAHASEVGLGAELQALALERARTVAQAAGLPAGAFLSINVSPRYLAAEPVIGALRGRSLGRLVIEVTEEEAVADYAALREAMARYLARGARFAVDDAGAGYASLRHVTELRPAFVKLDAALMAGLRDDTARQALLEALVAFTGAIGAAAVAEGVEAPADLALLARTGQPLLAQGYAIARPGPAWPTVEPAALAACGRRPALRLVSRPRQPRRPIGSRGAVPLGALRSGHLDPGAPDSGGPR